MFLIVLCDNKEKFNRNEAEKATFGMQKVPYAYR